MGHPPHSAASHYRDTGLQHPRRAPPPSSRLALEDELYALREQLGNQAFPKPAQDYLNDWASPDKGWLRKFYRRDSDEPQFDLTQRTVAQLSQQLRRFLDDQTWLENRRIMDILHSIEAKALGARSQPPSGDVMTIDDVAADIELPMERPLHTPTMKPIIANFAIETEDTEVDASALYSQIVVDSARLARQLRQALQTRAQVTLQEMIANHPLQHGLAELVAWLQLGSESFKSVIDEKTIDTIEWQSNALDGSALRKRARLPRVIFVR